MKKLINCENCGKEHRNPKYCSRSCAASVNNIMFPKRNFKKIKRYCRWCEKLIGDGSQGARTCESCNKNIVDWSCVTLEEFKLKHKGVKFHSRLRALSRVQYKRSNKPLVCVICGHERGVQVCHIKPVKNFELTDSIKDVNAIENLVALCPNHHWDLDHGFLPARFLNMEI